jgi:acyl dehydratase
VTGELQTIQSLFFGDLRGGETFTSPSRTVTEADLTFFSMISGDWSPIHSDAIYAESSQYEQRILHGPMGLALVLGLFSRMPEFQASSIAMLDINNWRFVAPIFVGDTLHLGMTVGNLRLTSRGDRGIVERRMELRKQDGSVAQSGSMGLMLACRRVAQEAL